MKGLTGQSFDTSLYTTTGGPTAPLKFGDSPHDELTKAVQVALMEKEGLLPLAQQLGTPQLQAVVSDTQALSMAAFIAAIGSMTIQRLKMLLSELETDQKKITSLQHLMVQIDQNQLSTALSKGKHLEHEIKKARLMKWLMIGISALVVVIGAALTIFTGGSSLLAATALVVGLMSVALTACNAFSPDGPLAKMGCSPKTLAILGAIWTCIQTAVIIAATAGAGTAIAVVAALGSIAAGLASNQVVSNSMLAMNNYHDDYDHAQALAKKGKTKAALKAYAKADAQKAKFEHEQKIANEVLLIVSIGLAVLTLGMAIQSICSSGEEAAQEAEGAAQGLAGGAEVVAGTAQGVASETEGEVEELTDEAEEAAKQGADKAKAGEGGEEVGSTGGAGGASDTDSVGEIAKLIKKLQKAVKEILKEIRELLTKAKGAIVRGCKALSRGFRGVSEDGTENPNFFTRMLTRRAEAAAEEGVRPGETTAQFVQRTVRRMQTRLAMATMAFQMIIQGGQAGANYKIQVELADDVKQQNIDTQLIRVLQSFEAFTQKTADLLQSFDKKAQQDDNVLLKNLDVTPSLNAALGAIRF